MSRRPIYGGRYLSLGAQNDVARKEMSALVTALFDNGATATGLAHELRVTTGAVYSYRAGKSKGRNSQRAALRVLCGRAGLKVPTYEELAVAYATGTVQP